jgi:septal ring factor EnvC (AmiA/AmiB activator)
VVLQHEKGFFTLYGHNSAVSRTAGEWVAAGDVIAKAGNTGGYEQPGLYFEVRKGADPMDPRDWLER